jgi:2-dehydro-3-deoxygluconokinase
VNTDHEREGRAPGGPFLPPDPQGDRPAIASLGEGLLEVGIEPGLDADGLGRGFGGDAANVAVMAARMGAHSRLITHVGDDAVGRLLLGFWESQGVDVSGVSVDPEAPTGLYTNEVTGNGAHSFGYYRSGSAASRLGPADLDEDLISKSSVLHLTGITLSISKTATAAARAALDMARSAGIGVAFDFNFRTQLGADPEEVLDVARRADIVFLADDEAATVIGTSAPERVLDALGGTPQEVLITRGAGAALLLTSELSYTLLPPSVEVRNAAGAGDALAGAYLAGRVQGLEPRDALAPAVAAASLSCRRTGCARGYPSAEEVRDAAGELARAIETGAGISALLPR